MLVRNIILFVFALCTVFNNGAFCATARGRAVQQNNQTQSVTSARAAVNSRTAPRAAAPATTSGRTTAARSAKPTVAPQQPKTVAARRGKTVAEIIAGRDGKKLEPAVATEDK